MAVSSGFPGGPGYTAFHFAITADSESDAQFLQAFTAMYAIKARQPDTWKCDFQSEGQILDPVSGTLVAYTARPSSASATIVGSVSGGTFGPGLSGAVCTLNTTTINRTRRVRGRAFVVPLEGGAYDPDGTLKDTHKTTILNAFEGLRTAAVGYAVWSRPRAGAGGAIAPVTGVRVGDKVAYLSSRR